MRTLHKRSRSSRKPSGVGFTFLQVEGTEVANVGPAGCTDDTTGYFRNERPDSEDEIDEDKWMHNESCDQTNLKAWDYASRFRTHFGTMHWETAWITVGTGRGQNPPQNQKSKKCTASPLAKGEKG